MNSKQEERRTRMRHEQRRERQWETFPERLLHLIDEGMPKAEVRDAVSAAVLRRRPDRKDAQALYDAICKRMFRMCRLRTEGGHDRAVARYFDECYLLEWALAETMSEIGEEEEHGCDDEN